MPTCNAIVKAYQGNMVDKRGKRVMVNVTCELEMCPVLSESGKQIGWACHCGNKMPMEPTKRFKPCRVCGVTKGHDLTCRNNGTPTEYQLWERGKSNTTTPPAASPSETVLASGSPNGSTTTAESATSPNATPASLTSKGGAGHMAASAPPPSKPKKRGKSSASKTSSGAES